MHLVIRMQTAADNSTALGVSLGLSFTHALSFVHLMKGASKIWSVRLLTTVGMPQLLMPRKRQLNQQPIKSDNQRSSVYLNFLKTTRRYLAGLMKKEIVISKI